MNYGDPMVSFDLRNLDANGLFRVVMDALPEAIYAKDRVGRYLFVNRAACLALGLEQAQCIGQTDFDLPGLQEAAPQQHAEDMELMVSGQPVLNREESFRRADGVVEWRLVSKYPLRNAYGDVVGLVGIARDASEARRAADELTQSRAQFVRHLDNLPFAVIEWQPDLRVQRWSGEAEAIFGWRAQEIVGRRLTEWNFTFPEDAAAAEASREALLKGAEPRSVFAQRNLTKDGRVLNCVWHTSVVHDADGRIVSLLSLVEDATDRKQADDPSRETSRLYRSLIESTGTGYVVLDAEAQVLEANSEYVRLTGRDDLSEIRGHRVYEWTAPNDLERNVRAIAACLKSGSIRNLEIEYVSNDGRSVPVELNARLIETGAGRRIIAICRDVSSRRALEAERQKLERKQQEAQRIESLAALAGGIGHDFNNLLTGVLGNASVAASELPPDSPALDDLEQIELAGTRAAELCKQLLAYAGKGRFVFRQVELNSLTTEAAELFRLSNGNSGVMALDLAPTLPPVLADSTQMREVIMNVLTNAVEAIETGGGGSVRVRTGVKRADRSTFANAHLAPDLPAGDYVFVEVTDDGPGISPELRSRMFDPFFTTKFTARGLGLASVLGIVRGHNGAVQVDSEVGRGTTIRIYLPVDQSESEPLPVVAPAPVTWRGHGVVLVIDDEVTIRRTATQMLRALGFEVHVAADGHEGIDLFLTNPDQFVVVLLDLTMPRLDGVAVLRSLRDLRPNARVIIMSGYDEAEVSTRFMIGDRPSGFLQKPFRLPDLRDKLRALLE